jgi:hypothetical protein
MVTLCLVTELGWVKPNPLTSKVSLCRCGPRRRRRCSKRSFCSQVSTQPSYPASCCYRPFHGASSARRSSRRRLSLSLRLPLSPRPTPFCRYPSSLPPSSAAHVRHVLRIRCVIQGAGQASVPTHAVCEAERLAAARYALLRGILRHQLICATAAARAPSKHLVALSAATASHASAARRRPPRL